MKYSDLIEKLLPFADEEINIMVSLEIEPADYNDTENWNKIKTSTVNFYRDCEESNDIIVTVEQKNDVDSFEKIEETKLITY